MSNSSILPKDRTLSGATTPGQSRPENDGNDQVIHIPQSPKAPSDWLKSYPGRSLGESYPYTEMQLMYSTAQADWAEQNQRP